MTNRLRLLHISVRLASRNAKLARQQRHRFRHAGPTRQQAVCSIQSLGLLSIGRPCHVPYAYYRLRLKSTTDPPRQLPISRSNRKLPFAFREYEHRNFQDCSAESRYAPRNTTSASTAFTP